ncbi:hypothetical protein D2V05_09655 [Flagellimonas pelagia]|uniref:Uncharacterized protein n=1 Tax=Flagellimonas pelagia TaxID=2306998 RepID=A0A3A1NNB0_9FLAO|nr:hypothetical protein D2V05_09655 [Allomuricauda maritima]
MAYLAIPIVLYVGPNSLKLLAGIFFNVFLALLFYGIFKDRSISLTSLFKMAYYSTVFLAGVMVLQFFLSALGIYKPHMYGIDGFFLLGRPAAFFGDPGWLAYWIILFSLLVYYFYRIGRLNVTSFYFFLFLLLLAVFINQSRVTLLFLLVNYFLVVLKNKTERKFFFGFFSP